MIQLSINTEFYKVKNRCRQHQRNFRIQLLLLNFEVRPTPHLIGLRGNLYSNMFFFSFVIFDLFQMLQLDKGDRHTMLIFQRWIIKGGVKTSFNYILWWAWLGNFFWNIIYKLWIGCLTKQSEIKKNIYGQMAL